ncbi:Peptidase M16 inactive domain-containing protein [Pelosinus propionicus DSM 13327]|uniref:Peptidase M16 inactive domain-containing protein n=2 Tax=Pelosinus TaxID=365348 RepID=A0A1I4H9E3_9FIRM|nr:Peptidase M16 inactive domain-containing protein [Pelosinus propionicus DSM 13327]
MLRSSIFAEEDIKHEKEIVLEICMYEDTPDELVHDLHYNNVWAEHPLGHNIIGTAPTVENFNKNMIVEYYQNFYTPDNIVIAGFGNLNHKRLEALVEYYFGNMCGKKAVLSSGPPNLVPAQIIQSKNIEQVHICLGTSSVPQASPDIYGEYIKYHNRWWYKLTSISIN